MDTDHEALLSGMHFGFVENNIFGFPTVEISHTLFPANLKIH